MLPEVEHGGAEEEAGAIVEAMAGAEADLEVSSPWGGRRRLRRRGVEVEATAVDGRGVLRASN